ncbi:TRAP-type C4-dicarboxylate transport system, substrate-binding protein [Salinihabitans flavidus]|uniref:TRAP-type C4-dicarboxylate transport system, substrate-binding protein n=1 Tax=Salinihabitans flavidus TaxID=569882 RepID=A0A1H8MJZ8_9RHOB|nr:TRAP transporter substrate-binding protein [Salinihabitans flavidus]SEO17637.1 TRAP-type C4-dicarboxylate transport system, substrate-binding protein [Salinihabitans flavidus]
MTIRHIFGAAMLAASVAFAPAVSAQVKIALDSPPDLDGSGSYVWAHAFAEYLNENGMEAEEYQRGALGGDDELFDQVSQGLLEVSMSPLNIVGSLDKLIYGLRLPYFFRDMEQVDRALNEGGMLAQINEATTPEGVRVLAVNTVGQSSGIFNTKRPVRSVSDMEGLRMRALDESQIELYEAWGAAGTIVSWAEVPNALQTGVADGYMNPAFVPLLFGHTDFLKHFTDARVTPSLRITIASEDWYQGLSDDERATVDAAVAAATEANREWLGTQDAVMDKLEEAGVEVVRLDQEARQEFLEASAPAYQSGLLSAEQIAAWDAAKGE